MRRRSLFEVQKLKKPEEALAMAGGSPLAALEPSADDRLSAKTENAVLEFLRAGPELSVDALVRLYAPDLTLPAFSLLVSRWAHDLMRSALGLQPRYFIDENAAIERLASHTDAKRAAGSARRRSRAAEQLTIRSILSRPLNRCCFAISRFFSEKGCKTRSSSPILAE